MRFNLSIQKLLRTIINISAIAHCLLILNVIISNNLFIVSLRCLKIKRLVIRGNNRQIWIRERRTTKKHGRNECISCCRNPVRCDKKSDTNTNFRVA